MGIVHSSACLLFGTGSRRAAGAQGRPESETLPRRRLRALRRDNFRCREKAKPQRPHPTGTRLTLETEKDCVRTTVVMYSGIFQSSSRMLISMRPLRQFCNHNISRPTPNGDTEHYHKPCNVSVNESRVYLIICGQCHFQSRPCLPTNHPALCLFLPTVKCPSHSLSVVLLYNRSTS